MFAALPVGLSALLAGRSVGGLRDAGGPASRGVPSRDRDRGFIGGNLDTRHSAVASIWEAAVVGTTNAALEQMLPHVQRPASLLPVGRAARSVSHILSVSPISTARLPGTGFILRNNSPSSKERPPFPAGDGKGSRAHSFLRVLDKKEGGSGADVFGSLDAVSDRRPLGTVSVQSSGRSQRASDVFFDRPSSSAAPRVPLSLSGSAKGTIADMAGRSVPPALMEPVSGEQGAEVAPPVGAKAMYQGTQSIGHGGYAESDARPPYSSASGTQLQFSGNVTIEGRRVGQASAHALSRDASLPLSTQSRPNIRSTTVYTGMRIPQ